MAGLRLELPLLLVVVLHLLTAPADGWERIDNVHVSSLLESGELGSRSVSFWTDDDRDKEEEEEQIPEEDLPYEEGVYTSSFNTNMHTDNEESEDTDSVQWTSNVDDGSQTDVDSSNQWTDTSFDSIKPDSDSSELDSSSDPHNDESKGKCKKPEPPKSRNCAVPTGEQVSCGELGITPADCAMMGCCIDGSTSACYYPMDECTGDQHFVFAIRADSTNVPVDPTRLIIPGHEDCKPVIVNDEVAIFKFKVTECGVRPYKVGQINIYLAEVQTVVLALNLKYGIITRTDPLRFLIECRYGGDGSGHQGLVSIGFMVKIPPSTLPPLNLGGLYAVLLRIAKDGTYSSFLPTYHQPLRLFLGKPIYLELYLYSPVPYATILVNYCLAYPRSAKNALVLVYEGCANPFDKGVSTLKVGDVPQSRNKRRFVVNAFQFMTQVTNKYLDEEIYFMCSTEVCFSSERSCEERCFDGKEP